MSSNSPINQRRNPSQARSKATWEAIVEAASQILERRGPAALNTNSIAERAGVSIGTLYQYFPDKHAILLAVARRALGAQQTTFGARQRALVQALIAMLEGVGKLGRGDRAPAPRLSARKSHPRDKWRRRVVDSLERILDVFAFPADPRLQPIPLRIRRR